MLPEVPTYREAGFDAEFHIWAGLYVPAGTPRPVVMALRESLQKAVRAPAFTGGMQKQSIIFDYRDAPEFPRFPNVDRTRMTRVARATLEID